MSINMVLSLNILQYEVSFIELHKCHLEFMPQEFHMK